MNVNNLDLLALVVVDDGIVDVLHSIDISVVAVDLRVNALLVLLHADDQRT